jgi:16S rRNA (uracil1498-N3)-methyltransferase
MYKFFVNKNQIDEVNNIIKIIGEDVNHIKNVLRLEKEQIIISDGQGTEYCCIIKSLNKDCIETTIVSTQLSENELKNKIYLFQGIPKGDKMELIISKTIELGVYTIIPVSMKRCVAKIDEKKQKKKLLRWNKIAESAAKQSKRGIIPEVREQLTFDEALLYAKNLDKIIVPYENSEGIDKSRQIISTLKDYSSIGVFIGPEGGFSDVEVNKLKHNSEILTLGKRTLRTETAGLATISIIMFNLEEE